MLLPFTAGADLDRCHPKAPGQVGISPGASGHTCSRTVGSIDSSRTAAVLWTAATVLLRSVSRCACPCLAFCDHRHRDRHQLKASAPCRTKEGSHRAMPKRNNSEHPCLESLEEPLVRQSNFERLAVGNKTARFVVQKAVELLGPSALQNFGRSQIKAPLLYCPVNASTWRNLCHMGFYRSLILTCPAVLQSSLLFCVRRPRNLPCPPRKSQQFGLHWSRFANSFEA